MRHPPPRQRKKRLLSSLPFKDRQDFEDARRGFIATLPNAEVKAADGRVVWDLAGYKFLESDRAPDTVNPSLWRQAQLNQVHGLFKVTDRVYQVRGFDLSNMTIVEGDTGLIVIDPLLSAQTAKAGLDLYRQHRPAQAGGCGRSTRTATPITSAACAASSTKPTSRQARWRSSRRPGSWSTRWPRTSSPAPP